MVIEKIATLEEIETAWCFDDVIRANAVLDWQQAAQRQLQQIEAEKNDAS